MATYFHGGSAETQAGELQTLYLMNPNYLFYSSDTHSQHSQPPPQPTSNMVFFNQSSHAPPPPPHMAVAQSLSDDPGRQSFHYNTVDLQSSHQISIAAVGSNDDIFRPPAHSQQGLSLSLQPGLYRSSSSVQMGPPAGGENSTTETGLVQSVIFGSKYLKAAQELLDEVVNVGKEIVIEKNNRNSSGGSKEKKKEIIAEESGGADLTTVQRQELQMKKAKLINMLDMVEQRYRQYHHQMQIVVSSFEQAAGLGSAKSYTSLALKTISKQFRCLKDAISAQIKATSNDLGEDLGCFGGGKGDGSSSRLRFIDHQLRQQRALQQLGMMQHNAWRPQRGLPERAVSVLRAWLFEHFLHPYPKDSDKLMLAKQTGLTRSQVSNWFINARVRLWKPMVEEMYLEEVKDQDQNDSSENASRSAELKKEGNGDTQAKSKLEKPYKGQIGSPTDNMSNSTVSTSPAGRPFQVQDGFNLIRPSDVGSIISKKPRTTEMQHNNSPSSILPMGIQTNRSERNTKLEMLTSDHVYSLISGGPTADNGSGFGTTFNPIGEIGRFHGNGSVSLTLGPPPGENNLSPLSGTQQNYFTNQNIHEFGRRLEMGSGESDFFGINTQQPSHSNAGFENLEMQNRKRFAAQLLPDFVA